MMPHFCTEFHVDSCISQLPSRLNDSQISRLALLFSPNTLETVALQHLGISQAQIGTSKADNLLNTEGFKRELLLWFHYQCGSRKVMFSKINHGTILYLF